MTEKSAFSDPVVVRQADNGLPHAKFPRAATVARRCLLVLGLAASIVACRHAGSGLVLVVSVQNPDALIVLASHERERLAEAARMAGKYSQARVLLTTPSHPLETRLPAGRSGDGRVEWLVDHGVEPRRIHVLPSVGRNTYEEARIAAVEFARTGERRLLVVTSAYHTRRALAVFQARFEGTGVTVGIQPASTGAQPDRWWQRRYDRLYVAYEWAAIASYVLRYDVWP